MDPLDDGGDSGIESDNDVTIQQIEITPQCQNVDSSEDANPSIAMDITPSEDANPSSAMDITPSENDTNPNGSLDITPSENDTNPNGSLDITPEGATNKFPSGQIVIKPNSETHSSSCDSNCLENKSDNEMDANEQAASKDNEMDANEQAA